jgi:hypothetical protein
MGVWGFYDNESDTAYEEFCKFKLIFIEATNKKLYDEYTKKNRKFFDEAIEKILNDYIQKNRIKAAKHLKLYIINELIKPNFSNYIFIDYDNRSAIITGLIIELLHTGNSPELQRSLPKNLFDKFPVSLQKIACEYINKSLKSVDNEEWSHKDKRINALKEELKLFKCDSKKTNTNVNTNAKTNINANAKTNISANLKTNKKMKIRKSPSESATNFDIGTTKTGNDGNIWIITITKNNIKRWKKI